MMRTTVVVVEVVAGADGDSIAIRRLEGIADIAVVSCYCPTMMFTSRLSLLIAIELSIQHKVLL